MTRKYRIKRKKTILRGHKVSQKSWRNLHLLLYETIKTCHKSIKGIDQNVEKKKKKKAEQFHATEKGRIILNSAIGSEQT